VCACRVGARAYRCYAAPEGRSSADHIAAPFPDLPPGSEGLCGPGRGRQEGTRFLVEAKELLLREIIEREYLGMSLAWMVSP
jgi:hypothetical protein